VKAYYPMKWLLNRKTLKVLVLINFTIKEESKKEILLQKRDIFMKKIKESMKESSRKMV
jgi:hypothetical protein